MRIFLSALMGVLFSVAVAVACDDHHGKCTLEAWRAQSTGDILSIDGSVTCNKGRATIRLYDGDKFLGVATGYIRGHALRALATGIESYDNLKIKYSLAPR